ncbi:hypothetical protein ABZ934_13920 [Streptomyces sp. NPDC046557]|uniref:hypothetical protein n=1 Tax=Streptomyces sp. NPDC046557 TaxID=3155372 RepID=UPI0033D531D2
MSAAGAARAAAGAERASGRDVSMGALLASCAAATAVSTPPASLPVRPERRDGAPDVALDGEQAAPEPEAA